MTPTLHHRQGIEHRTSHAALGKPQRLDGMQDPHPSIVACSPTPGSVVGVSPLKRRPGMVLGLSNAGPIIRALLRDSPKLQSDRAVCLAP